MTETPNIIYILADDMGYGDLSCLNENSKINTSRLDELASGGMIFRDAHSSSAVCTPSRYSILTGRYNWRSWLKAGVTAGYSKPVIEEGRMTVASMLSQQGYHSGCIGKWHLGWNWEQNEKDNDDVDYSKPISGGPLDKGFNYFYGISASLDMPPYVYVENNLATEAPDHIDPGMDGKAFWRSGPTAPNFKHEEVLPHITEKAVEYIDWNTKENNPFFLYFALPAPHTPILPTTPFRGKSGTHAYGDFCLQIDHVVGQLMDALEENGIAENTIVVFTADNGCSPAADMQDMAADGHYPSYIFRGHKADIYEGGHRIPLIIRWPQRISAGSVSDETVCLVDLFDTCADILNIQYPDSAGEDSISNLPVWEGKQLNTSLREATVHHSINGSFSIRKGDWKLEMCAGSGGWSYPQPGKECEGLPPIQLYNLKEDIAEQKNVYDQHPDVVEELKALLTQYVKDGRSTPGEKQENVDGYSWEQLWWILTQTPDA